jgi:hypothetical protein
MAFPEVNPKQMFIFSGDVDRIRPQGLQILTPSFFQHYQEVCNTLWFITVPKVEHRCMIEGWVEKGVIEQLLPFEKDFEPHTWRPQYYDGQVPMVNSETRRGANLSKSDPGYVPWWAHNGLQTSDNDWDLNISYYSNQLDMVVHYLPPQMHTSVQPALTQPVSSVSTIVQAAGASTLQMTTSYSTSVPSTAAPLFQPGMQVTSTSTSSYTGTGRPMYSRYVTSDGRVRRFKHGTSLPPRRPMRFIASRMCCPGDENLVKSAQKESKEDTGYDSPTALSIEATSAAANSGTSTILSSGPHYTGTISCDSTSPLKSPVKKPAKSTDQLEKEYLENIAELTDRDEEEWPEAISLLSVDSLDNELSQKEQRRVKKLYVPLKAERNTTGQWFSLSKCNDGETPKRTT